MAEPSPSPSATVPSGIGMWLVYVSCYDNTPTSCGNIDTETDSDTQPFQFTIPVGYSDQWGFFSFSAATSLHVSPPSSRPTILLLVLDLVFRHLVPPLGPLLRNRQTQRPRTSSSELSWVQWFLLLW